MDEPKTQPANPTVVVVYGLALIGLALVLTLVMFQEAGWLDPLWRALDFVGCVLQFGFAECLS